MTTRKMSLIILTLLYVFILLFVTWSTNPSESQKNIICVLKVDDQESGFWQILRAGALLAATEFDVNLEIVGPDDEADIERQIELIETAIEKNPDAIILAATDHEKILPVAEKIRESGIHFVMVDSGVKEPVEDTFIATDSFNVGVEIGRLLKSQMGVEEQVAIVSFVKNSQPAIDREAGIRKVFENSPERVIQTVYCDSDVEIAYQLTQMIIEKHPGVSAIACLNQYATEGVAQAIDEMNLKNKITVVGVDSSTPLIKYLEGDVIHGLIVQKPLNMGYISVEKALELIRGNKVQAEIDSGLLLVTKKNMYTGEYQKALFPNLGSENN